MYKAFFGLTRNPFDLTPDPRCFVSTEKHNEALAALYYGVRQHKGFVVVTGEVGTGKTMLLRCLLRLLKDSNDIAYAYVFNNRLTPGEFFQYVLTDFGLPAGGKNKAELLLEMGHFLLSRESQGLTTVLVIDEAHHLSAELLEEIRLLSNLETADNKLLQILLVGQPELDEKLDSYELRQLKQRISLRARLERLSPAETRDYIAERLQIAGTDPQREPIFPSESIAAVYRYSGGLPRLINTLCENSLIGAYARRVSAVTPDIVEDVAREFRLDPLLGSADTDPHSEHALETDEALFDILEMISTLRKPTPSNV
jgi:general secretion pathway protein A